MQLLLVDDNNMAHDPPVISAPLKVTVADAANRDDRNRNDPSRRNLAFASDSKGIFTTSPNQPGGDAQPLELGGKRLLERLAQDPLRRRASLKTGLPNTIPLKTSITVTNIVPTGTAPIDTVALGIDTVEAGTTIITIDVRPPLTTRPG